MQIGMALEKYVLQLRADGRSEHTVGQYRRHVRLLDRWLRAEQRGRQIDGIDHEDLARFLASPTAQNRKGGGTKKPTTANALRSSLRCFFGYLHKAGYIKQDPARLIRRARCGAPPPRALSEDEQKRLLKILAKASDRDRILFTLMLRVGLRLGSALGLHVEDLNLEVGELRLRRAKNDREERVFIPGAIRTDLEAMVGDRTSGPVFVGREGRPLSTRHARRRFRRVLEAAGIKRVRGTHTLRHSFATRLYERTGDIALVQRALHHRLLASTLVYAQPDERRLRRAMFA